MVSLAFLLTSLIVVVMPGTGALITLTAGVSRGARAGVVAAFGCTLGIVPHLIAAVTGAAALLRASGVAFDVLRVVGVVYLLFMAVVTWRDKSDLIVVEDSRPRSPVRVIVSAMLSNLLNPTDRFLLRVPPAVCARARTERGRATAAAERGVHGDDVRRVRRLRNCRGCGSSQPHRTTQDHPACATCVCHVFRGSRRQARDDRSLVGLVKRRLHAAPSFAAMRRGVSEHRFARQCRATRRTNAFARCATFDWRWLGTRQRLGASPALSYENGYGQRPGVA